MTRQRRFTCGVYHPNGGPGMFAQIAMLQDFCPEKRACILYVNLVFEARAWPGYQSSKPPQNMTLRKRWLGACHLQQSAGKSTRNDARLRLPNGVRDW